jgi:hypothetical protein
MVIGFTNEPEFFDRLDKIWAALLNQLLLILCPMGPPTITLLMSGLKYGGKNPMVA